MKNKLRILSAATLAIMTISAAGFTVSATDITPDTSGHTDDATVQMNGETISQPTYTVIIPEKVDFENLAKTTESNVVTKPCTVSASGVSNLFANQKKLVVTVASKNNFKLKNDGTITIPYTYYLDTTTVLPSDKVALRVEGSAAADTSITATANSVIAVDTKNITKAGSFTDVLTYTVALVDL